MRSLVFYIQATLLVGAAGPVLFHAVDASALSTGCRATPSLALDASTRRSGVALSSNEGYRLESVRWDPLLQQSFAVVSSCARPDLPSHMLLIDGPAPMATSRTLFPVVHAGDVVRIVSEEEFMRIELTGIAEENGAVGARVRVHLLRPGAAGFIQAQTAFDGANRSMQAVIRGPHEVELER